MKILVTGGCGFIGSNLVRLLIREGHAVINLDKLTYAGNAASLADLADHPNYHFECCDLAAPGTPFRAQRQDRADAEPDHSSLASTAPGTLSSSSASSDPALTQKSLTEIFDHHQPDAVMHLAAESHVDRSIDGPGEFIQTNIVGTYNLLQASLAYWKSLPVGDSGSGIRDPSNPISHIPYPTKRSFRFLHVSTDEVYGSLAPDAPGFAETTPYDPHSPYSASKAASDHLARAWGDTYGLPVLVTNCSNNYGPYQFPEKLIPVVILKCLRGEPIPVYGKGENIRDWLYVEDHCEALYTVLTKGRVGEIYNIGGNNEQTNLNLVKLICKILGEDRSQKSDARNRDESGAILTSDPCPLPSDKSYESLITFVSDRPGHDARYAIDARKIHDELGWAPKQDSKSGFEKTVQWYLENRDWWENILSGDYKLERLGEGKRKAERG